MINNTPAQKKLISYLKKRDPSLTDKEIPTLLNSIKRFVNLTRKIYTEPQARVTYKDRKVGGKIKKDRIFNTDLNELSKVMGKKPEPINNVMQKFHKAVTKGKYD